MCATSDTIDCWEKINFDTAEKCVKKLQKRIALAFTNCNDKQVECLQKKLIVIGIELLIIIYILHLLCAKK